MNIQWKCSLIFSSLAFLFCTECSPAGFTSADFRWSAPLTGSMEDNKPVRVALSSTVIKNCQPGLRDIRVLSDRGNEVPYTIYWETDSRAPYISFNFHVIGFEEMDGVDIFTLEKPEDT